MSVKASLSWLENKSDVLQSRFSGKAELTKCFFIGLAMGSVGLLIGFPPLQAAAALMMIGPTAVCGLAEVVKSSSKMVRKVGLG